MSNLRKDHNIHSKETFKEAYKDRTWDFYRYHVAECIRFGQPGQWVDLGSGCGFFVECANRFGIPCVGLEGSQYAISKAKSRDPNIDVRQHFLGDKLPFENDSISTVVCNQVIEHLPREIAIRMLSECYRVLKLQGVLLIFSPSKYDTKQKKEQSHINLYTPKSLKSEVACVGFEIISARNAPREIFGSSFIARAFAHGLYFLFPFDFLSASANCIAIKLD